MNDITNAVVLGYILGRNMMSSQILTKQKKAYRKGIVTGDNGNEDVIEPTQEDDNVDVTVAEDGKTSDDPAANDLNNNGWWIAYGDPDTGTISGWVRVWIEPYHERYEDSMGFESVYDGKITSAKYDASGNEIERKQCDYWFQWKEYVDREETATNILISSGGITVTRNCHSTVGAHADFPQDTFYYFGSIKPSGERLYTTNVRPF